MYYKAAISALLIAVSGCVAAINEEHLFATMQTPTPSNPSGIVNVFRIDVDGQSSFANVRYISGTYDERAVDFFLNEVKSQDYTPSAVGATGSKPIFNTTCPKKDDQGTEIDECKEAYEDALKIMPLKGDFSGEGGTFVMILSTNANAIAETIGAFAENDVAIKSFNYMLNKDTYDAAANLAAAKPDQEKENVAIAGTLDQLFAAMTANDTAKQTEDTALELAILYSVAVSLRPEEQINFSSIEEAKVWFRSVD